MSLSHGIGKTGINVRLTEKVLSKSGKDGTGDPDVDWGCSIKKYVATGEVAFAGNELCNGLWPVTRRAKERGGVRRGDSQFQRRHVRRQDNGCQVGKRMWAVVDEHLAGHCSSETARGGLQRLP